MSGDRRNPRFLVLAAACQALFCSAYAQESRRALASAEPITLEVAAYGSVVRKHAVIPVDIRHPCPDAFTQDGAYYVSFSQEGKLTAWDTNTGKVHKTFPVTIPQHDTMYFGGVSGLAAHSDKGHGGLVIAVAEFLKERVTVLSGDGKTLVQLPVEDKLNLETELFVSANYVGYAGLASLRVSSTTKAGKPALELLNLPPGTLGSVVTSEPSALAISADERLIAYGLMDERVRVQEIETKKELLKRVLYNPNAPHSSAYVESITFSPSGKIMVLGTPFALEVVSIETGKTLGTIRERGRSLFIDERTILVSRRDDEAKTTRICVADVEADVMSPIDVAEVKDTIAEMRLDPRGNLVIAPDEVVRQILRVRDIVTKAKTALNDKRAGAASKGDRP